ncbi:MAG: hypothetical protein ACREP7_20700, partial [Lysobacter sp.]
PSDYLLQQLALPLFHGVFQLMIFAALLESGTGAVHAINQRVESAWRARRDEALPKRARLALACALLMGSIFLADRVGLVDLIARGYRGLSYLLLAVYVLPLLTWGLWQLRRGPMRPRAAEQANAHRSGGPV